MDNSQVSRLAAPGAATASPHQLGNTCDSCPTVKAVKDGSESSASSNSPSVLPLPELRNEEVPYMISLTDPGPDSWGISLSGEKGGVVTITSTLGIPVGAVLHTCNGKPVTAPFDTSPLRVRPLELQLTCRRFGQGALFSKMFFISNHETDVLGFRLTGEFPPRVQIVYPSTMAHRFGIEVGSKLIAINRIPVASSSVVAKLGSRPLLLEFHDPPVGVPLPVVDGK